MILMIKKLYILTLFSLKIVSSDLDPKNCLTCYASSCLVGLSAILATQICTNSCPECSCICASSVAACKIGKHCHKQFVRDFDENDLTDRLCAESSGLVAAVYCLDCITAQQCTIFPLCAVILPIINNQIKQTKKP